MYIYMCICIYVYIYMCICIYVYIWINISVAETETSLVAIAEHQLEQSDFSGWIPKCLKNVQPVFDKAFKCFQVFHLTPRNSDSLWQCLGAWHGAWGSFDCLWSVAQWEEAKEMPRVRTCVGTLRCLWKAHVCTLTAWRAGEHILSATKTLRKRLQSKLPTTFRTVMDSIIDKHIKPKVVKTCQNNVLWWWVQLKLGASF